MSETVFARFPRFDEAPGQSAAPAEAADKPSPAADEAERLKAETTRQLAAMEAMLASLSQAADAIAQQAQQHVTAQTVALAKVLFPELAKRFLADEIGCHLPKILPQSSPRVTLRAEPELAVLLKDMIARSDNLSALCTVVEDEAPGSGRVDISWGAGGVDFDFAGLLEACVNQLESAHTKPGDKS